MNCHTTKCKRTPPVCTPRYAMLHVQSTSMWNSDICAYVSQPLTSNGMLALFVVNSVKLYLTACKIANLSWNVVINNIQIDLCCKKTGNGRYIKSFAIDAIFLSALFLKDQIIISVKKNLMVKQIANMYDCPYRFPKFGCKIIALKKATFICSECVCCCCYYEG